MPKVSVLIPTYNCVKFLFGAIESVLKQTYRDFEIIVIDDGSTDSTRNIIKQYLTTHGEKIKYIHQENKGLACARNTGIKNSQGEYIALLDADDEWLPNRLEEQMIVIENNNEIGLVHANITFISEDGSLLSTPKRNKKYLSGMIFNNLFLRRANISCPTVLLRKKFLSETGFFDENLTRLGCEDRDMWLRLGQKYKVYYIDNVLALYRVRKKSMSHDTEKMLRARYYVVNKLMPISNANNALRNIALSNIHQELGNELLHTQKPEQARRQYIIASSFRPFSIWPWINLIKASLQIWTKHVS